MEHGLRAIQFKSLQIRLAKLQSLVCSDLERIAYDVRRWRVAGVRDIDWDDLRHVLALVQHQTMAAAAANLRVHQTTLSRRISGLEQRLQTRLFDRIGTRFSPTSQGMIVVRRAQEMESASRALNDDLSHDPAHGRAVVRL